MKYKIYNKDSNNCLQLRESYLRALVNFSLSHFGHIHIYITGFKSNSLWAPPLGYASTMSNLNMPNWILHLPHQILALHQRSSPRHRKPTLSNHPWQRPALTYHICLIPQTAQPHSSWVLSAASSHHFYYY